MKKLSIIICCMVLAGMAKAALAGMSHKNAYAISDACSELSQLSTLACALAPSASFDNNKKLWLAWVYGGHVYVNYSTDYGKTFSAPLVVNRKPEAISAKGENRPKIIVKNKRVYVSWTHPLKKRFSGNVRFSISIDGGEHFSEPINVNDDNKMIGHRFDAMRVNDNGDIFIAWLDKRDRWQAEQQGKIYHGAALYYSWSDNNGQSFSKNIKIIDHSCECCRVVMGLDQQLPVVLWRNIYGNNTRDHSLVKFVDKNQPSTVERVSYDEWRVDACPHHGPDMAVAERGDYHLVWFDNATDRHGLFYRRRQPDGSYTKAFSFGDYRAGASHPNVINVNQDVWLTWKQFDGKQASVWLQHSDDNGTSWQPAKLISTAADGDYPFLLSDGESVFVQWQTSDKGFQLIPVSQ